ncbi:glycosyltransferase [Roseovarius sp. 2305UL8-3]|uniref:glycosyltransferase n=1 Tax=Roseovarius conchicola TaxID=3121636 RepID=UPI003529037A
MTIAYVLNTYPQPSHSFIRREIAALEAAGQPIIRIAMRRATMPLVDPLDREEEAATDYVLERGGLHLLGAMATRLIRAPSAWMRALRLALRVGGRSPLGRIRHLIYFAEGCAVANRCEAAGTRHIHAHFGTNSACVAMLAHAAGGPTYSFTVHGPEEFDATKALFLDEKTARAAFTVAISQFGRSQLCRWVEPDHWPRIKVVHCAIEPAKFPEPTPVPNGPPRLVSIGRFSEQKGQLVLIEAMAQIAKVHPEAHLTLIGDGEMRPLIEAAITRANLDDHITLTGWLDESGIREELSLAQALIMPSFAEGLPMVIMEAMAAGRPVIATTIAGIPELVRPGKTGWLVPAGDADALVEAVDNLAATDTTILTQMGREGRERVLTRHDNAKEAAKLAAHFESTATGSG